MSLSVCIFKTQSITILETKDKQILEIKLKLSLLEQKFEKNESIDVEVVSNLMKKWQKRMPKEIIKGSLQTAQQVVTYINQYATWGAKFITPTWNAKIDKSLKEINIKLEELFMIIKVCYLLFLIFLV